MESTLVKDAIDDEQLPFRGQTGKIRTESRHPNDEVWNLEGSFPSLDEPFLTQDVYAHWRATHLNLTPNQRGDFLHTGAGANKVCRLGPYWNLRRLLTKNGQGHGSIVVQPIKSWGLP